MNDHWENALLTCQTSSGHLDIEHSFPPPGFPGMQLSVSISEKSILVLLLRGEVLGLLSAALGCFSVELSLEGIAVVSNGDARNFSEGLVTQT